MNTKRKAVIKALIIIAILISGVAISFAYFTARISGREEITTVGVTGGTMSIIYNNGNQIISEENILPSNEPIATKKFTVTGNNTTDLEIIYSLSLVVDENTFSENALTYTLSGENTSSSGIIVPDVTEQRGIGTGKDRYIIGNGSFNKGKNKVHSYELKIYWPETDQNQEADQGKRFQCHIAINEEYNKLTLNVTSENSNFTDFYRIMEGSATISIRPGYRLVPGSFRCEGEENFTIKGRNIEVTNATLNSICSAEYTIENMEITVYYNDETGESEFITLIPDEESETLLSKPLTRSGWNFGGWSTQANGMYPEYTNLNDLFITETNPETIYALWYQEAENIYLINNLMGEPSEGVIASLGYPETKANGIFLNDLPKAILTKTNELNEENNTINLPCQVYEGHTTCTVLLPTIMMPTWQMVGWSKSENYEEGNIYKANSRITLSPGARLYYIASRELIITYHAEEEGSEKESDGCLIYNNQSSCEITLKKNIFTKEGYTYNRWLNPVNAENYEIGSRIVISENKNLYANWESGEYVVTMSVVNATLATASSVVVGIGGNANFIFNAPEGYTHEETKCNGNTIDYNNGISLTDINENITCISKFKEISYEIEYSCNGCLGQGPNKAKLLYSDKYTLEANPYTRVGYEFLGWDTNHMSHDPAYGIGSEIEKLTTVDGSKVIIYAIWRKQITSTFTGALTESCYLYNNESTCAITTPNITKAGYSIIGWDENRSSTTAMYSANSVINVESNNIYYPITKKEVTIRFIDNGAEAIDYSYQICTLYNEDTTCAITTPNITRANYELLGYSTNATDHNASVGFNNVLNVSEEATYYAITKLISPFIASFYINDEENVYASASIASCNLYNREKTCQIVAPTLSSNVGYTALGWHSNQNAIVSEFLSGGTKEINGNVSYYAISKNDTPVTINFNQNNAENIGASSLSCTKYNGAGGCYLTAPSIIPKSGSTVLGWHREQSSEASEWAVGSEKLITSNDTYYAITKSAVTLTVSYVLNGAEQISKESDSCQSASCNFISPGITREGYEIVGWSSKREDTISEINANTPFTITENTTLYAITRKKIEANFNINGASTVSSAKEICNIYNTEEGCSITTPSITRENHQIVGWNTSASATTSSISVNTQITLNADITYYAITKKEINITFNGNGATSVGSSSISCSYYNTDTECEITSPSITREGFEIIGWNIASESTESSWNVGVKRSISNNATYYAITKKQITISFDKNNATSISSTSEKCTIYNTGSECNITTPTITREDWVILGWDPSQTNVNASVNVNTGINVSTDTTYYAITRKDITVTFNLNYATSIGSNSLSCSYYNGNSGCSLTAPSITRADWQIVGWGTTSGSEASSWNVGASVSHSSNATYHAITKKDVTVSFNANSATSIGSSSLSCSYYNGNSSCNITAPSITRSNWQIVGWGTTSGSETSSWNVGTSKAFSTTSNSYYAITRYDVTATFNANGASSIGSSSLSCSYYNNNSSCNITAPTITRSGYTILGWDTSSTSTSSSWNVGVSKSFSTSPSVYYAISFILETTTITLDDIRTTSYSSNTTLTGTPKTLVSVSVNNGNITNYSLNGTTFSYTVSGGTAQEGSTYTDYPEYLQTSTPTTPTGTYTYSCPSGGNLSGTSCIAHKGQSYEHTFIDDDRCGCKEKDSKDGKLTCTWPIFSFTLVCSANYSFTEISNHQISGVYNCNEDNWGEIREIEYIGTCDWRGNYDATKTEIMNCASGWTKTGSTCYKCSNGTLVGTTCRVYSYYTYYKYTITVKYYRQ